jgi:hypothetical protein
MRVRKTDKYLLYRLFWKVLAQVTHRVSPHHPDVIVLPRKENPMSPYLFSNIVSHLLPNLQPKDQLIWKGRSQCKQQPSVPTSNIQYWNLLTANRIISLLSIPRRILICIAIWHRILLTCPPEQSRVVLFPIDIAMMRRVGETSAAQRVGMCPCKELPSSRH